MSEAKSVLSRYCGQLAVEQRLTSVELPGQVESTVTGFCLMQVRCLVEKPLLRVMQPLEQGEGRLHSDQVAELLRPGLTVFFTQEPGHDDLSIITNIPPLTLVTDLVCPARCSLQGGARPVVAPPARSPALEAVADLLHVGHGVVQPGVGREHEELALGVPVPLLPTPGQLQLMPLRVFIYLSSLLCRPGVDQPALFWPG